MTGVPDAPADMRMMGIVHDALRRDLGRAIDRLSTAPCPDGAQRIAIGNHVSWMMGFLEAHHHGEDAGLWPLVRSRNPEATPLLDAMEADHARVDPLVEACEIAAHDYGSGTSDATRVELIEALRRLCDVLLPHLEREENETMPLVSVSVTAAEWRAIDQQYYIKPKSLSQLGFEGHWLLDGLDPERSQIVVHQVPLIPRFVLVHGFARRYRRRATACWGPPGGAAQLALDVVRPGGNVAAPDPAYRQRRHRRRCTDRRGVECRDGRDTRRRMEPRVPSGRMARRRHHRVARSALSRDQQGGSLDVESRQRSPRRRRAAHVRVANRADPPVSR